MTLGGVDKRLDAALYLLIGIGFGWGECHGSAPPAQFHQAAIAQQAVGLEHGVAVEAQRGG